MRPTLRSALTALIVALLPGVFLPSGAAWATVVSGFLNDPANSALVASDGNQDLRAPRFGSDAEVARNVAVYELTVTTPGSISFSSSGYAAGGAEPYFTLFTGSGTAATFLDSNFFDPNIDFNLGPRSLAPGVYMFALGVWENLSFAENLGTGTLGDAFTALGDPSLLGNSFYEINVTSTNAVFALRPAAAIIVTPVPEPASILLVPLALVLMTATALLGRRSQAR